MFLLVVARGATAHLGATPLAFIAFPNFADMVVLTFPRDNTPLSPWVLGRPAYLRSRRLCILKCTNSLHSKEDWMGRGEGSSGQTR